MELYLLLVPLITYALFPAYGNPTTGRHVRDIGPLEFSVKENGPARMICQFKATGTPKVIWEKDGKAIQENDRLKIIEKIPADESHFKTLNTQFHITSTKFEDAGVYTCKQISPSSFYPIEKNFILQVEEKKINKVAAMIGENVPLVCGGIKDRNSPIEWTRNNSPLGHNPRYKILETPIEWPSSSSLHGSFGFKLDKFISSLTIKDVQEEDFGTLYTCMFNNTSVKHTYKSDYQLTKEDESKRTAIAKLDQQAIFSCKANLVTKDTDIKWRKDDKILSNNSHFEITRSILPSELHTNFKILGVDFVTVVSTLLFKDLQLNDYGIYTCHIENEYFSAVFNYFLNESEPIEFSLNENESTSLLCQLETRGTPKMIWEKDGKAIQENDRFKIVENIRENESHVKTLNTQLFITSAKFEDAGVYTCKQISPSSFYPKETNFILKVEEKKINKVAAMIGDDAPLLCVGTKERNSTIEWARNNSPLGHNPRYTIFEKPIEGPLPSGHSSLLDSFGLDKAISILTVKDVQEEDFGTIYTCMLNNTRKKRINKTYFQLTKEDESTSTAIAKLNEQAIFNCYDTLGTKDTDIKWRKDGKILSNNSHFEITRSILPSVLPTGFKTLGVDFVTVVSTLLFKDVQLNDYGIYTCHVENEYFSIDMNYFLNETNLEHENEIPDGNPSVELEYLRKEPDPNSSNVLGVSVFLLLSSVLLLQMST